MRLSIAMLVACAIIGSGIFMPRYAGAQAALDAGYEPLGPDDLRPLVAPVALYPDAMLAQILVACTYPNDVASAAQYLDAGNDPNQIDNQGWDLSVAGVARYPDLLHYMVANGTWMNSLGAAFFNQQADVINTVQTLRGEALAAGNLVSNDQQQVVVDGGTIEIIPTDPNNLYPPIYDPNLVYQPPTLIVGDSYVPLIHFWNAIPCGVWLHHDIDWHDHAVYLGSWGVNRPWWSRDPARGQFDYTRDRPGLHISNTNITVNVHNRQVDVKSGEWTRQSHDPQKPMPKYTPRAGGDIPIGRPGTGYEAGRQPVAQHPSENSGAISNYNHAPTVQQQSNRGSASRQSGENRTVQQPNRPIEAPARRAIPAPAARPAPEPQPRPEPASQSPAPQRSAPVERGSAVGGYGNGEAASAASSRGAASRGGGGGSRR